MNMRMPFTPLFNIDPYFSVWSIDKINTVKPQHWTNTNNSMLGIVTVDGEPFRFLGVSEHQMILQTDISIDALSTTAIFRNEKIELTAVFTSPAMANDLYYLSRPVVYLKLSYKNLDGKEHKVCAKLSVSEELVLLEAGNSRAVSEKVEIKNGNCMKMGNGVQNVLSKSGDTIHIDWGYLYLAANKSSIVGEEVVDGLYAIYAETEVNESTLFVLGYGYSYGRIC